MRFEMFGNVGMQLKVFGNAGMTQIDRCFGFG